MMDFVVLESFVMKVRLTVLSSILSLCLFAGLTNAFGYDGIVTMGFGDSITLGYPYIQGYGNGCNCGIYEKYLEQMLEDNGYANLVFNWGYGGESTAGGLNRISSNIQSSINNWGHVDFVLLMEGTNDYSYGFSKSTTIFNLSAMIDRIRSFSVTPLLGTLTPDTQNPAKNVPEYNSRIRAMASDKNVILVDHYAAMVANWGALNYDGLHPNTQGYYQMAGQWFEHVYSLLGPINLVPVEAYFLLLKQ